jgi:hypothetical protein
LTAPSDPPTTELRDGFHNGAKDGPNYLQRRPAISKITSTRNRRATADTQTDTPAKPPPLIEGDLLLSWLRENDPENVPTDRELAAVELIGTDCTDTHIAWLYADLWHASVDEVRAYWAAELPEILLTDAGARLNGYHREHPEHVGRTLVGNRAGWRGWQPV